MSPPKLVGAVGPGYTISLKQNGKVGQDAEGRRLHVRRLRQSQHPQLPTPGQRAERRAHDVPFVGTKTVIITAQDGQVKYYCVPHESSMFTALLKVRVARRNDYDSGSGSAAPAAIVHASSSPVGRERIRYGRDSQSRCSRCRCATASPRRSGASGRRRARSRRPRGYAVTIGSRDRSSKRYGLAAALSPAT